jgi:glycosyltransferase involved in cell wall biosynthesis
MTGEQVLRWPDLLWEYAGVLRRRQPVKIVHTNWHHLLLLLPFLRPDRDLFWLHECIPDLPQYRRVFGWLERRLGCFVCVSHAVARSLRQIGIQEDHIRVIHNGLKDPAASAGLCQPPDGRFRIGIAGQVGAWKGHEDLLEAFASVHQNHPEAELHIFGTGDAAYIAQLKQRSAELAVADCIRWYDFVSDRNLIYTNLDVCVVPSRSQDPLPTTAIEAGFFRVPIIATRRGGLPEIVEHEANGLLVEAERPAELAGALCRLIEQPSFRQSLATNARQHAIEHFGEERFLREFLTLLNSGTSKHVRLEEAPQ